MSQLAAGASGPADPQVVTLIDGVIDERVVVAVAIVRFEATLAKSDLLGNDESSAEPRGSEIRTWRSRLG
jgi:hypothetical protein